METLNLKNMNIDQKRDLLLSIYDIEKFILSEEASYIDATIGYVKNKIGLWMIYLKETATKSHSVTVLLGWGRNTRVLVGFDPIREGASWFV